LVNNHNRPICVGLHGALLEQRIRVVLYVDRMYSMDHFANSCQSVQAVTLSNRTTVRSMYWWDGVPNFGDAIGPDLVRALLPVDNIRHARAGDEGVLLGPGSILDYASKFRDVVIWGTGFDPHYGRPQIKNATILAVRGPLTAKALGINVPVLGDPGLLLPEIYPLKPTPNDVAVIPHHSTFRKRLRDKLFCPFRAGYRIIDPRNHWTQVVQEICRSRFVFCQSLHGAIVAHAYGVPWCWWRGWHGRRAAFKWKDWFASIGLQPRDFRLAQLREAEVWGQRVIEHRLDAAPLRQIFLERVTWD